MKPEAQRIAIAEACGWRTAPAGVTGEARWFPPLGACETLVACYVGALPEYLNDLNAMHEAKKTLNNEQLTIMLWNLKDVVGEDGNWFLATAEQEAEAFLRTLNLWTND